MNGMEMMLKQVFNALGVDGAKITETVNGIGAAVTEIRNTQNRIERNQARIAAALNVTLEAAQTKETENVRHNGAAEH